MQRCLIKPAHLRLFRSDFRCRNYWVYQTGYKYNSFIWRFFTDSELRASVDLFHSSQLHSLLAPQIILLYLSIYHLNSLLSTSVLSPGQFIQCCAYPQTPGWVTGTVILVLCTAPYFKRKSSVATSRDFLIVVQYWKFMSNLLFTSTALEPVLLISRFLLNSESSWPVLFFSARK